MTHLWRHGRRRCALPFLVATLLSIASTPHPAFADGPALARLTLQGETHTLTADPSPRGAAMIERNGDTLYLHFAQLHLSFPTPPNLYLTLHTADGRWHLADIRLHQTSTAPPVALNPDALRITAQSGDASALALTIEGEAMTQGGAPIPVHLQINLRSP